jgi:hypothetical protein
MEFIKHYQQSDWVQRLRRSQELQKQHKGKVPVLVDRFNIHTPKLEKNKYLVNRQMKLGQFVNILRQHLPPLQPHQSLIVMVDKGEHCSLPIMTTTMGELFNEYHDQSNFLLLSIQFESTFGEA